MEGKARVGRGILIIVTAFITLIELGLAGYSFQVAGFRPGQIGRVLLTVWLLWQVWDGSGWARWLLAGLFLAGAVFAIVLGFGPRAEDKPQLALLMTALAVVFAMLGLGLASPWVGAYQSARRADPVV
jgi:hypothetical protein